MFELSLLVAPIFLIILLGKMLSISFITDDNVWQHINKLAYWVLFPCLLFNKTSTIDFENFAIGYLSITVVSGFLAAAITAYILGKLAGLSIPSLTSVIQGGGRHNAFISLAIVTQLYGDQGAIIGAIIIAVLVSFTNIVINSTLSVMLSPKGSGLMAVLNDLKRNPFILAIFAGFIFNILGWDNTPVLHDFTLNVGNTALTIALLCVGGGLQLRGSRDKINACMIACFAKFIIFPATVYMLSSYFQLPHIVTVCAMVFATSSSGSVGYPLAKQMGGDAPLMATIISLQTLLSVLAIPAVILLLQS